MKSTFTPKKPSENSYIPPQMAKFDTTVLYYLKQGTTVFYLPEKSKLLYSKFGNQSPALKSYLSHKGTTLKQENDFVEVVKLLDSAN
ncbi:MAG: hypothetical protein GW847_09440 [Zetaproteobacteria bacterium]|nr:hypothetical protein [Zetaproteobacteria bacterium]